MPFSQNETSEDSFTLTASSPSHLDTGNRITLSQTSTLWTFTAAEFSGVKIYALDPANAQKFINGQGFQGYLLDPNDTTGMGFITVPAGTYYIGSLYQGSLSAGQSVHGFVEVSTLSNAGENFLGNVPLGVSGQAGSWKSIGFQITGAPDLYIETEGTGGTFVVMSDAQYQSFASVFANGFHGGAYSLLAIFGQGASAATELEGQFHLSAGHYELVWINDTSAWQGGAGNIWGYAPSGSGGGVSQTAPVGAPPGGGGGGTGGLSPTAQAVQGELNAVLRWGDGTFGANLVNQVNAGQLSQTAATTQILHEAQATASVATLAYEFFTGKVPSSAGMDYLVSPTGPNPNNLNSAYYQSFSLENRYINFAVNLGKVGEGNANFTAQYGGLSLFEATRKAYATIFGEAPSDTKLHAILDPTTVLNGQTFTRASYFAYYGQDGSNGIGTKAAMVGWLLSEAEKADLGTYALSNDAFLTDVALHSAPFAVDIIGHYSQPGFVFHPG